MDINRAWVMPNKWTFKIKPVQELLKKYNVGAGWIDPFAGECSPAQLTNDIEEERNAVYNFDGLDFLKGIMANPNIKGFLFDSPYSVEQCLRRYTPKQAGTVGRAEYWAKCKDEIKRLSLSGTLSISFGWDSCGMGRGRGFEIIEILLLCHGACHNDTIITVERKT